MSRFLWVVMIICLAVVPANGATLVDVYPGDGMVIVNPEDPDNIFSEIIAEDTLVPYPFMGSSGIVNSNYNFFDMTVDIVGMEVEYGFGLELNVTNSSGLVWSDFHFEFFDLNQNLLSIPIFYVESIGFDQTNFIPPSSMIEFYDVLHFWSDSFVVAPGETTTFTIVFDSLLYANDGGPIEEFVIRQVATTAAVPLPGAAVLLGSGMLGLALFRRKINP